MIRNFSKSPTKLTKICGLMQEKTLFYLTYHSFLRVVCNVMPYSCTIMTCPGYNYRKQTAICLKLKITLHS